MSGAGFVRCRHQVKSEGWSIFRVDLDRKPPELRLFFYGLQRHCKTQQRSHWSQKENPCYLGDQEVTGVLPFPNLWVLEATHCIVIPRVTLVERYHGDGPLLVPAATQQVPDYANPCVRGLTTRVACRYCKRVRSTSAAAETQIVGSDLRTFQRRHWKVLSAVAAYVT